MRSAAQVQAGMKMAGFPLCWASALWMSPNTYMKEEERRKKRTLGQVLRREDAWEEGVT